MVQLIYHRVEERQVSLQFSTLPLKISIRWQTLVRHRRFRQIGLSPNQDLMLIPYTLLVMEAVLEQVIPIVLEQVLIRTEHLEELGLAPICHLSVDPLQIIRESLLPQ